MFLLDTVALMMWWADAPHLGCEAREVLETAETSVSISVVSVWEIANKNRIGKLPEFDGFEGRFWRQSRESGFAMLDINAHHAMRAGYLPGVHRDPFDRLIAGQALFEDMTVVTNDPEFVRFGCKVIW